MRRGEAIASKNLLQCGNHPRGNLQAAGRYGVQVKPFSDAELNRYERILASHARATGGLSSAVAEASRLARLTVAAPSAKQQALRDIAASVAAPTLVGYVLWVLCRAEQLGLRRLYFIARDGQILLEIAHRLVGQLNIAYELRYLYGSRRAWLLPAMTNIDDEQLSLLQDLSVSPTVRHALARLDIAPEEISESLSSIGFTENSWSRNLNPSEYQLLCTRLKADKRLHQVILEKAAAKRPLLLRYLKQEGLLDPIPWGMVDIGWKGRPQNAVGRLLTAEGGTPPASFCFGMRKGPSHNRHVVRHEVYFFDEVLGVGFINLLPRQGLIALMEAFCSADHGQVVGYEERANAVCPVLNGDRNHQVLECGLPLLRDTIYCVADHVLVDANRVNLEADLREAIAEVLQAFWLKPSASEVRAFAAFPCEMGVSEDTRPLRLAEGYGWHHVAQFLWTAQKPLDRLILWDAGAYALSPLHIRCALRLLTLVSKVCKRSLSLITRTIRQFPGN